MQQPVAIVCVNYNGGDLLHKTISSLYENTFYPFKLFLVDNNSTDLSVDNIRSEFPEVNLIKSGDNLGFGKGNNLALQKILGDKVYRYTCLINSDLEFSKDWLSTLVKEFEQTKFKNLASLNPLLLTKDKYYRLPIQTNNSGIFFHSPNEPRALKYIETKNFQIDPEKSESFATRNLEDKKFISPLGNQVEILVNEDLKELQLEILDPFLKGFKIKINNQMILQKSNFQSFRKKLIYFINKQTIPTYNIELDIDNIKSELEIKSDHIVNSFGGIWPNPALPSDNLYGLDPNQVGNTQQKVDYGHGACLLISTRSLRNVGLFDPEFFMYYEDADLGIRLNQNGYTTAATPKVKITHLEGGGHSEKTAQFMLESQQYFRLKYYSD